MFARHAGSRRKIQTRLSALAEASAYVRLVGMSFFGDPTTTGFVRMA